jgi:outer membrane receptor for monomeric catechols
VTVINKVIMDQQAAYSLPQVLRNVPGITLGAAEGGTIGNNINLRGFSARTDIYLDGARDRGQYYRDVFFLDAVEVLKGPSSMLFGRGSTGGVINQVSKTPSLSARNEVSTTVGTSDFYRATADFNKPLSDTAAFRIALMGQKAHTTRDVMYNEDYGVAPSLSFGLGTPTQVTFSALLQHNRDMPDYGVPPVNGQPAPVPNNTFYGLTDDRTVQDVGVFRAVIDHKFSPSARLRNQTQYSRYKIDALESGANSVGTRVVSYGASFDPSLETLVVTSGQQALPPVKNKSMEVGGKWDFLGGNLSLNSALFRVEQTNARSQISTGVYQLTGDVLVKGFEFGIAGRILPQWQVMAGYTFLDAEIVKASALDGSQGKVPANTPRNSASLWTTYNLTREWEAGGGFTFVSERFANNQNFVSVGSYTRFDATVAYHQANYELRLNLLNLTDVNYYDALIPSDSGRSVPGTGRTALMTFTYKF